MKKITLLILVFICAIGYSQTKISTLGPNNPTTVQQQRATSNQSMKMVDADKEVMNMGTNDPVSIQKEIYSLQNLQNRSATNQTINAVPSEQNIISFGANNPKVFHPNVELPQRNNNPGEQTIASMGANNPVSYQKVAVAVGPVQGEMTTAPYTNGMRLLSGVQSFSDMEEGTQVATRSNNVVATVVSNGQRQGGTATFTVLADFQAACTGGSQTSENFDGGPGGITNCGPVVSSAGDGCFGAGVLEDGFDIQASNATDVIYIDNDFIGNTYTLNGLYFLYSASCDNSVMIMLEEIIFS